MNNIIDQETSNNKVRISSTVYKVLLSLVHIGNLILIINRFYGTMRTADIIQFIISVLSLSGLFIPVNTVKKVIGYTLNVIGGILIAISSISIIISLIYFNGYFVILIIVAVLVLFYGVIICLTGTLMLNEIVTAQLKELRKMVNVRACSENLLV